MSDHPKEAKRNLKRIRICDDACFDVFRLLPPKKVGLEVAAVSDRFDALVGTQFEHYRKWTLGKLRIFSDGIIKISVDEESLPFPQVPLPNSVVGFAYVGLYSFSSDAIAFIQRIVRLLQSDISLQITNFFGWKELDVFATRVLPQLSLSAIVKIYFEYSNEFHNFRRVSSPSILCDCTNLRFVNSSGVQSLQFPSGDSDGSSDGQALCQWLHTPRADGRPKVFICYAGEFRMDELKTHFLSATTPVNFIYCRIRLFDAHPFELINSFTNEQMTCRLIGAYWMIVRCPIDKNAKQWAEWEEDAVEYHFVNDWKFLQIYV